MRQTSAPLDKGSYTYEKRDPATGAWKPEAPVQYVGRQQGTKVFAAMMERFDQDSGERRVLERHADRFGKMRPRTVADSRDGALPMAAPVGEADSDAILFAC